MITAYTTVGVAVAVAAGVLAAVLGLAGRKPSDLSLAGAVVVELLLIVQVVIAIVAPGAGNPAHGNPIEFWVYLVSALLIPPAAVFWALVERTRWATVVVGIGCLAVAVMFVRMEIIWSLQSA